MTPQELREHITRAEVALRQDSRQINNATFALLCTLLRHEADRGESPPPDAMATALDRQCDNMAFVLNHVPMPEWLYEKLTRELAVDRAVLAGKNNSAISEAGGSNTEGRNEQI